jgi:hypothetical protein
VAAFVAVSTAGVPFVLFGHVAPGGLTTTWVALAWLDVTFRGSHGHHRQ